MNINERHWRRLLTDIEGGQVIPVVGPELLEVSVNGETRPLYDYVADEVSKRLGLDEAGSEKPGGFNNMVSEFLVQSAANPQEFRNEDLYYEIRDVMATVNWEIPESLKKLVEIQHFQLFVSTSFDSEMKRALNDIRYAGQSKTRSFAYCTKSEVVDLPNAFQLEEAPTVYSIFGKLNPVNDFAVTDQDILEFAYRLQSRDMRPHNLFDHFRNRNLLMLGCSFPGWLTRFFLAAAKGDELFSAGSPGIMADQLSKQDPELVGFLQRSKTSVYTEGNGIEFVTELHRRWTEKFGDADLNEAEASGDASKKQVVKPIRPESVFISFHSGDRETARNIAASFEKGGIDVWFDENDLETGDYYREKIESNIEKCLYFVPLISKHSTSGERRFFQLEWNKAIDEAKFRPQGAPFIQPILVDETPAEAEGIPAGFRPFQFENLQDLDSFIEVTRRRIRDRRREGRAA